MSRWLHHTENSRGAIGLSSARTRPILRQIMDIPCESAYTRASASPQTFVAP